MDFPDLTWVEGFVAATRPRAEPADLDPAAVLSAVERMDDGQRRRLAELIGVPAPSRFLWAPDGRGNYQKPLVPLLVGGNG